MADVKERVAQAIEASRARAVHEELEAAVVESILATEHDLPALQLYADWLQEQGDPRGELIARCGDERGLNSSAIEVLRDNRGYFLGIFGEEPNLPLDLEWNRGTISAASLYVDREWEGKGWDQGVLTDALLALPAARFLQRITLGCASVHESDVDAAIQAAIESRGPHRCLTDLTFITNQDEEMLSWTNLGDISHLGRSAPQLRRLSMEVGGLQFSELELPHLESLVIETCGLTIDNLECLARGSWPKLKKLTLWFGSRSYGVDIPAAAVAELLDGHFPALEHLGLCNNELTGDIVDLLADHPLLGQLRSLDLSNGTLDDAGGEALIARAHRFHGLRHLDLSANYIQDSAEELERAIPRVELGDNWDTEQRVAEEWEGASHRYAAIGE